METIPSDKARAGTKNGLLLAPHCALACSSFSIQLSAFLRYKVLIPLQSQVLFAPEIWLFALHFLPQFLCMSNSPSVPGRDFPAHHGTWVLRAAFPRATSQHRSHPPVYTSCLWLPLILETARIHTRNSKNSYFLQKAIIHMKNQ